MAVTTANQDACNFPTLLSKYAGGDSVSSNQWTTS